MTLSERWKALEAFPLVERLEMLFLPEFARLASELWGTYVACGATSHSVGAPDVYPCWIISLNVRFLHRAPEEVEDLSLIVSLNYLTTTPQISVSAEWGQPSNFTELEIFDDGNEVSRPFNEVVLAQILATLPEMCQLLKQMVKRGYPPPEGREERRYWY